MQHFGKEKFSDREDQLFQMAADYGMGAVFDDSCMRPSLESARFVEDQYERFKVPLPHKLSFLLHYGTQLIIDLVNNYDPYLLFYMSNVHTSDDWTKFTYEILDNDGNYSECNPNYLDTFMYVPGKEERFFDDHINKPGVTQLPGCIAATIQQEHQQTLCGDNSFSVFDYHQSRYREGIECYPVVIEFCKNEDGTYRDNMADAYFDLSLWAGTLWLFGPLSGKFRYSSSTLIQQTVDYGECILYEGNYYNPTQFRKSARTPMSCYMCGLSAWCVEATLDHDGVGRYICEHCSTESMVKIPGMTCGSKFCRYWDCKYNAYYMNPTGAMGSMREHGQLAIKAKEIKEMRSIEQQGKPLIEVLKLE